MRSPLLGNDCRCLETDFRQASFWLRSFEEYCSKEDVIVLAVPAGGVPVGYVVAKELGVPMDVVIVRKVQIPWNTEAGFGAVTWDGETVLNEPLSCAAKPNKRRDSRSQFR